MLDRVGRFALLNALRRFNERKISSLGVAEVAACFTESRDAGLNRIAKEIFWECSELDYYARNVDCPMMNQAVAFLQSEDAEWLGWR